jgi:hypothetical protein
MVQLRLLRSPGLEVRPILGVVCIVLLFLGGIGVLVAFVAGWFRADRWGITNLMPTWTALWAASFLLALLYVYTMPGMPSG